MEILGHPENRKNALQENLFPNRTFLVAICEDEEQERQALAALVYKWARQWGYTCEVRLFACGEEFLFAYEDDKAYDILLLDMEMGETSGLQVARRVREHGSRAEILFVTSHFEFAGEGYEVDALHYLVKPVEEGKLMEVLSKAAGRLLTEPPSIVITCEGETVKLYEQDIRYVESFGHYIVIHTGDGNYKIKENISAFAEKLGNAFFRTHRSYLVSLQHIIRISRTSITIQGGTELPLARGNYDAVNRAFISYN